MLAGYFSNFSSFSHLPFDLGLVPKPNQSFFFFFENLGRILKCSFRHFLFAVVPPKCFVQDPGKDGEDRESPVFPTMGAVECLGSAVIGGRS